jgi:arylsulfatase A-like enzyme
MFRNGEKVSEQGYLTDLMTREALGFLDRQSPGKPFFLSIGYLNPHTPYDGHPQKYYDLYAGSSFDTFGWQPAAPNALREKELLKDIVGNIRKCAASVTALDDQLPLLLAKLTEKRLRDNTLIVFSGDNGFLLGRHGLWSKGLASDPINMYDEVVQTPMIWNWPGRVPVEASRPEMVSAYDLLPSLCDAAGIAPPAGRNLCGRSYLKLAQGFALDKKEVWPSVVFGHFRNTEMARDPRFKLVVRNNGDGPNELFDLRTDPREQTNLYDNPAVLTVRDRLSRELDEWRKKYSS